jgi:hypothetical protein
MTRSALTRCRVVPLPDHQVSIQIDEVERLRWHYGPQYPRPFFYPLVGPAGHGLTRMGHPGAPDHDHHRSIWFAHNSVVGVDFWSEQTAARIRQLDWLCYDDDDAEARMAVRLGWFDGHDPQALLEQETIVAVRPLEAGETAVEFALTWRPVAERLELGQTNFGLLGVRVAKSLSVYFGGGSLSNSEGRSGEPAIFEQAARWVDYSGLVGGGASAVAQGITYIDHATNPGHPAHWHVREDGWMIASPCMQGPLVITRDAPLTLRYLLYAHAGACDAARADALARQFDASALLRVVPAPGPHTKYMFQRG